MDGSAPSTHAGGGAQQRGPDSAASEHDSCGVGLVVDTKGRMSQTIVSRALTVLENLLHRRAVGLWLLPFAVVLMGSGIGDSDVILIPPDPSTSEFGFSMAGVGDIDGDGDDNLIVGAPGARGSNPAGGTGAAYVFRQDAVRVSKSIDLFSTRSGSAFGYAVSGAGDVNGDGFSDVIVSAPQYDTDPDDAACCLGAAFVFFGSATGIPDDDPITPYVVETTAGAQQLSSDSNDGGFGFSVASGDVNGDGFTDVIIAAGFLGNTAELGSVFVFLGSSTGIASGTAGTAHARLDTGGSNAEISVASGDVNADGYDDVIVGRPRFDTGNGSGADGAVFIFLGGPVGITSGDASTADAVLSSDLDNPLLYAEIGWSVASADVNGDGYADVIVGAPLYVTVPPPAAGPTGAVFVFHGSAAGIQDGDTGDAQARLLDGTGFNSFGRSVAAGDVDGDGHDDVIVGDPNAFPGGRAFVFLGSSGGVQGDGPGNAHAELNPPAGTPSPSHAGDSVAAAFYADGRPEPFLGAPRTDTFNINDFGRVYYWNNDPPEVPLASAPVVAAALLALLLSGISVLRSRGSS